MSLLSGEYWINGHNSDYADSDLGPDSHESLAYAAALGIYPDELSDKDRERVPAMCEDIGKEDVEFLLGLGADEKFLKWVLNPKNHCDMRLYAMKEMGWIRVQDDNFQLWKLGDDELKYIQGFDEFENVETAEGIDVDQSDDEIAIEELSTGWYENIPLKRLFAAKSAAALKRSLTGVAKWHRSGENPRRAKWAR